MIEHWTDQPIGHNNNLKEVIIMAHQMTEITSDHRSGGQRSRIEGNHINAYKTWCFWPFWHNNTLKKY